MALMTKKINEVYKGRLELKTSGMHNKYSIRTHSNIKCESMHLFTDIDLEIQCEIMHYNIKIYAKFLMLGAINC